MKRLDLPAIAQVDIPDLIVIKVVRYVYVFVSMCHHHCHHHRHHHHHHRHHHHHLLYLNNQLERVYFKIHSYNSDFIHLISHRQVATLPFASGNMLFKLPLKLA